ncbi:hypothetical protein MNEG_4544 [Monoraphidium neglectum]|uniref:Uncharacterized protein n=1 Tax=Monoraphidium neglectum TaxID=145388 RepID=A0A0D2MKC6_9CHLO|nr:hypothetical protein MNEG_4544 [Monoraphidium neglectum]KIZ03415.1 hypothetical protein MNEG_4544 [Monoraphidium neglectum]|eukprot:XP_013902434.1 hypothetical protein MNEG_4544 [Monoraphidium neglectum]
MLPAVTSVAAASPQVPQVYSAEPDAEIARFQEHQRTAARPTVADEARTLFSLARSAVLSTKSAAAAFDGFPFGSVVEFAVDAEGRPILATSTLSPHTGDLIADGRCSLTVTAPGFQSLQDARFTLAGKAVQLPDSERAAVRETFLAKYPSAFYVDFGDFRWFRLEEIKGGRFIGGFGRIATISAEDYQAAKPDPISQFAGPVCGHMNADHEGDILAMVKHYTGLSAVKAKMLDLDRLGFNLQVTQQEGEQSFKVRLPFVRPAEDRKAVKDVIVEMTRAARGAAPQQ